MNAIRHTLIFACMMLIFSVMEGQDCNNPTLVCFEEGDNIISDSTNVPTANMFDFGCIQTMNGVMYEVNTIGPGDVNVEISAVACSDLNDPFSGDSVAVVLFQSSSSPPCNEADFTVIDCAIGDEIFTVSGNALAAGETYYVFVAGDMDVNDVVPAECDYNFQIYGAAVERIPPFQFPEIYHQITAGESVLLESSGADSYQWAPAGSLDDDTLANPTATPPVSTEYTLVAEIENCPLIIRNVFVEVIQTIVPFNILTPNDDNKNDVWEILFINPTYPNADVRVFTRWGQQVFRSNGYPDSKRWDGTNNGSLLPAGAYYYVIDLNLEGIETEPVTGAVTILY